MFALVVLKTAAGAALFTTLGNGFNTHPNLVGDPHLANASADLWFNPQAFAAPARFTFGNAGVGILDGPGKHIWDTAMSKNFYFRETRYVQFRWEMFNAPNHVNLSNPTTTTGLSTTGKILSTSTPARSMQFGLKINY